VADSVDPAEVRAFVNRQLADNVLFADVAEAAVLEFGKEIRPLLYQEFKTRYGEAKSGIDQYVHGVPDKGMAGSWLDFASLEDPKVGERFTHIDLGALSEFPFTVKQVTDAEVIGEHDKSDLKSMPLKWTRSKWKQDVDSGLITERGPASKGAGSERNFRDQDIGMFATSAPKDWHPTLRKQKPEPGNMGDEVPLQNEYPTDVGPTNTPLDFRHEQQSRPRRFQEEEGEDPADRTFWEGLQENKNVRASVDVDQIIAGLESGDDSHSTTIAEEDEDKAPKRRKLHDPSKETPDLTTPNAAPAFTKGGRWTVWASRKRTKIRVASVELVFTDRYDIFGPPNGCTGQCEGTGVVPIQEGEQDPVFKQLWEEAEAEHPSDDGWHFVPCPECSEKAASFTKGGSMCYPTNVKTADRAQEGGPKSLKAPELDADSRGGEKIVQGESVPAVGDSYLTEDGRAYSVHRTYQNTVEVIEEDVSPTIFYAYTVDQINRKLTSGEWQKIGSSRRAALSSTPKQGDTLMHVDTHETWKVTRADSSGVEVAAEDGTRLRYGMDEWPHFSERLVLYTPPTAAVRTAGWGPYVVQSMSSDTGEGIWVEDESTNKNMAEFTGEEVQEMIDQGFFQRGSGFKQSVLDYLKSTGVIKTSSLRVAVGEDIRAGDIVKAERKTKGEGAAGLTNYADVGTTWRVVWTDGGEAYLADATGGIHGENLTVREVTLRRNFTKVSSLRTAAGQPRVVKTIVETDCCGSGELTEIFPAQQSQVPVSTLFSGLK
jgi:hypothetical protein